MSKELKTIADFKAVLKKMKVVVPSNIRLADIKKVFDKAVKTANKPKNEAQKSSKKVSKSDKPVVLPVYSGTKLTKVLETGHNKVEYLCAGVDSRGNKITLHVPRRIIDRVIK